MKNKDIYDGALRILGEKNDPAANLDYEERAPYIIAAFCSESADLDEKYRAANNLEKRVDFNEVFIPLENDFPCCKRFASAACMYLSSMLVLDEDGELSDRLFDKYSDIMSAICSEIPAYIESVTDRYGFI